MRFERNELHPPDVLMMVPGVARRWLGGAGQRLDFRRAEAELPGEARSLLQGGKQILIGGSEVQLLLATANVAIAQKGFELRLELGEAVLVEAYGVLAVGEGLATAVAPQVGNGLGRMARPRVGHDPSVRKELRHAPGLHMDQSRSF